jgi:DNA-binding transcriptional MerR regulator
MIPNKSVFKFQELTPITGVKPYVIRFWETEFTEISPVVSDSGQKLYARKDIEAILQIKKLLFDEKLSIPEAKAMLRAQDVSGAEAAPLEHEESEIPPRGENHHELVRDTLLGSLNFIREIKAKRNW